MSTAKRHMWPAPCVVSRAGNARESGNMHCLVRTYTAHRLRLILACLLLALGGSVARGEQRTITGPARLGPGGTWRSLEATDGTNSFKTGWPDSLVKLEHGTTYTFIVEFHQFTEPSVEKNLKDD